LLEESHNFAKCSKKSWAIAYLPSPKSLPRLQRNPRGAKETLPEPDGSPWCDRIHARCRRFCGCTASTSPRDVEPESTLEPPSPPPQARFLLAPGEERRGATVPAHPQLQLLPSCWWRAPGAGGRDFTILRTFSGIETNGHFPTGILLPFLESTRITFSF
jgi:hypothetical protein